MLKPFDRDRLARSLERARAELQRGAAGDDLRERLLRFLARSRASIRSRAS